MDVRTIDNTNSNIAGYLPPGSGMVIPVKPLRANTRYTATATLSGDGDAITKTWSFTTLALENTVSIEVEPEEDGSVRLTVSSDAPGPVLSVTAGARKLAVPLRKSDGAYVADLTAIPPGTYQACASAGGGGYQAASACRKVAIPVVPLRYVTVSSVRVRGRVVSVVVTARAPFVGRRAIADLHANIWCSNGWCAGPRLHRTFALRRTQTFTLPLPHQHSEVFLQFTIPGGKIGTAPYNLTVVDRDRIVP